MNMNKRELILAKKTFEANQLKNKNRGALSTACGSASPHRLGPDSLSSFASTYPSPDGHSAALSLSPVKAISRRPQTSSLSPLSPMGAQADRHRMSRQGPATDSALAELARRGLTDEAKMRKMTIEAMNKTRKRGNTTVIGVPDDANYFMPKVPICRPDGASLQSVYDSKRQDLWGQIIRAQVVEDEEQKRAKRREREQANESYSHLLTEQVRRKDEELRRQREIEKKTCGFEPGGMFEVIDEKQRLRDEAAKLNQVEYVNNALHDMELKRRQKDQFLQEELQGAAVLAREAELQAELERQRVRRRKQEQIERTERLFKENVDLIAERSRLKQEKDKADIAYVKEVDAKFAREDAHRKAEVARRFQKANSDGPANQLTMQIKALEEKEREMMYETFREAENSLNRQLKRSEDITEERNHYKKTALLGEYDKVLEKNRIQMEQMNREKEKARRDILEFQKKHKEDSKAERQRQVEAAARYQRELNEQLEQNRLRSLNSLRETMSDKERKFNADMIKRLLK